MSFTKLQNLLDEHYEWPCAYQFKFVVKTDKKHQVLLNLEDHEIEQRPSRNGNYTSITSRKILASSSEVIQVYEKMKTVEGVITL